MSDKNTKSKKEKKPAPQTVKYSSLTILDNSKVATHTIAGTINDTSYKDFSKFLNDVYEHNEKINVAEREAREQEEFNKIHDPEAKPKFTFKKDKIERINLIVDSYGGACCSMTNITALMMASPIPIDTYCFGVAMSAGFMIFIHGKRRYVSSAVNMMTHSLSAMVYDNAPAIKTRALHLDKMNKIYQDMITSRTGLSSEWMVENEQKDVFFTSDEVLEHKIADVLVTY